MLSPYGQNMETAGGREVSHCPRSLIADGPLHFVGIEGAHCGLVAEGGELMEWARILACITDTVDQELLLRNEYLEGSAGR
jgi:hypothetical protein